MEFITTTSLAYGCMGLCCEMFNLVVLGQILWFRCWFSVMKIRRGKPFFDKKNYYLRPGLLVPIVFWVKVCPRILLVKCEWKMRFCYTQTKKDWRE